LSEIHNVEWVEVGENIHQRRLVELVRYEQRQRSKTKQGVVASFLISISKKCIQPPPPHSQHHCASRLTNIHRDNNRNRHSPRQQAFTIPPPATTDRHSFISINGKLTSCSEASAFRFQAHSI
jgi:hypothetical protein